MAKPVKPNPKPTEDAGFVTSFVHWRSGKRIYAKDYGHKAFPLGKKK